MVKAMKWQQLPLVRFLDQTPTEITDMKDDWGIIYLDSDKSRLSMITRGAATADGLLIHAGIMTDLDHRDEHDVVVNNTYTGTNAFIVKTIQKAIDDNHVSVFVRNAGDLSDITIAAGDDIQRLQGTDADTTVIPVNITSNRDEILFQELALTSKTLTLAGGNNVREIDRMRISATGKISITAAAISTDIRHTRFRACSTVPLEISVAGAGSLTEISRCHFSNSTSTEHILIPCGANTLQYIKIQDCMFHGSGPGPTDYMVQVTRTTGTCNDFTIENCKFGGTSWTEGSIDIYGTRIKISHCWFQSTSPSGLTAGKRAINLPANGSADIGHNTFLPGNAGDVMIDSASTFGVNFHDNIMTGGTYLGSQGMQWINNYAVSGTTIDFQSNTGQVVIGGDMTGVTWSNVPADLIVFGCEGQADRWLGNEVRGDIIIYNSTPTPTRLAVGADGTTLQSDGTDPSWAEIYVSHQIVFSALNEDLTAIVIDGFSQGVCVGESGEHGTFTGIRGKATAETAGTGTTTIVIEADNTPAFSSAVTLFTLALNTSTEVDDTTLDNTWATGDIWVRARCTAVGATAPKDVRCFFTYKQRAENY